MLTRIVRHGRPPRLSAPSINPTLGRFYGLICVALDELASFDAECWHWKGDAVHTLTRSERLDLALFYEVIPPTRVSILRVAGAVRNPDIHIAEAGDPPLLPWRTCESLDCVNPWHVGAAPAGEFLHPIADKPVPFSMALEDRGTALFDGKGPTDLAKEYGIPVKSVQLILSGEDSIPWGEERVRPEPVVPVPASRGWVQARPGPARPVPKSVKAETPTTWVKPSGFGPSYGREVPARPIPEPAKRPPGAPFGPRF